MSPNGVTDPVAIESRLALLDALEAVGAQRAALILVGAQAVDLRAGFAGPASAAAYTRDADLAIDLEMVTSEPNLDAALTAFGFVRSGQPGSWLSQRSLPTGERVPVDFLVPEAVAGRPGRRAAYLQDQPTTAARQVRGLEGVLVDNDPLPIESLDEDARSFVIPVAGQAALLVAKLHKISDRLNTKRQRDKDALDIYRLLQTSRPDEFQRRFTLLRSSNVAAEPTSTALSELAELFGSFGAAGVDMVVTRTTEFEPEDETRRNVMTLTNELLATLRAS